MATPLRVLLIEDSEKRRDAGGRRIDARGLCGRVRAASTPRNQLVWRARNRTTGISRLPTTRCPDSAGTAALALLREYNADIPFSSSPARIGKTRRSPPCGRAAHDYIMKGHLKRLAPAVERELRDVEVRRSRRSTAEERLVHLAYHDPLTDICRTVSCCTIGSRRRPRRAADRAAPRARRAGP